MAYSKSTEFEQEDITLANMAKALGHPARVAILKFLAKNASCFCGDIVEELPLSQSTVSQHLKALKEADLIQGNIEGNKVCYCLNIKTCEFAIGSLVKLIKECSCC